MVSKLRNSLMRNPYLVFLSRQALDIFIALKTFAGGSAYVLP
jgi:hypothetical protein